jgi:hypothetical protein
MYSKRSGLIIGFHGCDLATRDKLLKSPTDFKKSENVYDWLGHGMYFWEYDCERALAFAQFKKDHHKTAQDPVKTPAVIGAVINLGFCLDLLDSSSIKLLTLGHEILEANLKGQNLELPKNKKGKTGKDFVFRHLDCAVIQTLHLNRKDNDLEEFDSVRGVFWEGKRIYKNAGFRDKNHIQICIRNPNCIKGFFLPRESSNEYKRI